MNCIRCAKELGHADSNNADYVIADEFKVIEKRPHFYAVGQDEKETEIQRVEDALGLTDIKKVEAKILDTEVQKTGLICPDCYQPTDFIIWGVHKA